MKRLLFTAIFFCIFLFIHFSGFGQRFTLLKDINGGNLYEMPRPVNLIENGSSIFFRVGYPLSTTKNRGPQEGFWKSDGSEGGTVQIKALAAFEVMEILAKANGSIFFTIFNTNSSITELWKSDGTEAGTIALHNWSIANPTYQYRLHDFITISDFLYFVVRTSEDKDQLWRSDGTIAGTTLVKSFDVVVNLVSINGNLFFSATENAVLKPYNQLWKTDGTTAGTVLVKDVDVRSWQSPSKTFVTAGNLFFFIGYDGINGSELWKSDGTQAGTAMVKDIEPGQNGSVLRCFAAVNGVAYFFATNTQYGDGLWKSDGTSSGTVLVKNLDEDPYGNTKFLTSVNNAIFFNGYDDSTGLELWKSDGTEAGTIMVKDIVPGLGSGYPMSLTDVKGILYFATSGVNIWKSDGTEQGTVLLQNFQSNGVNNTIEFATANGFVFFSAFDDVNGYELRKTDGTPQGTVLVKNIVPTPGSNAEKFVLMNGEVYFTALNNNAGPGFVFGRDLYKTEGTYSSTVSLPINPSQGGGEPLDMALHNNELFISARSRDAGYELWKSTGDRASRLKDINLPDPNVFGNPGSNPNHFKSSGQYLFFSANNKINGDELWKTDGTESGTVLVKDINSAGDSNPHNLENISGAVYFAADDGTNGIELWKSDGSEAGTVLVKNINTSGNSNPSFLTNVNGVLYFIADDGINGIELWKSDGTEAGTVLVRNINAGGNSNPSFLTNINGTLYFAADDGVNGVEVWKSNSTDAGTVLVKDIFSGPAGSNPASFINFNGIVLFAADDGISGRELWGSVGTNTGTILIKDIQPGPTGSNPSALTKVGNNVLFAADDGVHGSEVWLTNSSEQGTRMMSEIEPGPNGSNPTEIFEYGAKVLVSATNEMVGSEVWIADAVADIVILPDAAITVNGPLVICNGGNITLKANTGNGYTYQWKKTGVNIAGAIQANYIANQSGSYAVVVTDAFGRTATSEVVVITTGTPPVASIAAAGPLSFCAGKNVLLKAVAGNGYTYQWKKAGTNIDNAISSNYTATEAGTYSVIVTNAGGCSATSPTLNVTINPVPLANVAAASSLTFCEGKTVQLKAITGNGYTYQWKRGGADIAGGTSSNLTASTTGIYNVVITNASGCSASSAGMTVVVRPLPAALITPAGPTTFCSGKNVLLRANTGTNYTYQWIRGAAAIPGAIQSNYSATQPGLYTVIVTNSSGCSVTSAAVAINVNPLPASLITPAGPTTFCAGQNVMLRANTGTNYTYQWKKSGVDIAGATLVNYTASAAGIYSVVVSNASGCPVVSAPVTVTVNNAPLASVAAAGPTTFCAGKNVLLKAINGAGYTYQWKKNGINIPQETTSNYIAATAGTYTVVVTNASGCSTTSTGIPVTVTMAPLATVAVAGPLTFCEGKNVLLKAITGTGYTYQWKKNGVNIPSQSQSNFTATTSGVYTVAVTNAEGCSTLSSDINVVVTPAPAAIITPNGPLTFQQGGNVVLNASTAAGNTYQWKKDGVNISGATTESYTATISGSYAVVVTNAIGCQSNSQPTVVSVTQSRLITKNLNQEEQLIKVYPNPLYRNSYLNIDWNIPQTDKGVFVTVYDMSGKKINSQLLKTGDKTVKITGASGIYMVECRWGTNKRVVFRVAKIE